MTRINNNAFAGATALKNLTQAEPATSETPAPGARATNQLASTLTAIGQYAFAGTGLTSIDLSQTKITGASTATSIQTPGFLGNGVFQDATSLSSVTLPSGLTTIPAATFAGTTSLTSIEIPSSVNKINAGGGNDRVKGAFEGSGLESIDLSKTQIISGGDTTNSN